MSEPDSTPTPDPEALRATRPGPDAGTDEQQASTQGPGTASESSVDEDLGSGDR